VTADELPWGKISPETRHRYWRPAVSANHPILFEGVMTIDALMRREVKRFLRIRSEHVGNGCLGHIVKPILASIYEVH